MRGRSGCRFRRTGFSCRFRSAGRVRRSGLLAHRRWASRRCISGGSLSATRAFRRSSTRRPAPVLPNWNSQYRSLIARLDDDRAPRAGQMEQQGAALTEILTRSGAFPTQLADVRQLVWLHLKLLAARSALREVIDVGGARAAHARGSASPAHGSPEQADLDPELRSSLEASSKSSARGGPRTPRVEALRIRGCGDRSPAPAALARARAGAARNGRKQRRALGGCALRLAERSQSLAQGSARAVRGLRKLSDDPPPPELLGQRARNRVAHREET